MKEGTGFPFTDGCPTSPGPCETGAAISSDHHQPIHLKRPVAKRGFIFLGGFVVIIFVLEYSRNSLARTPLEP